MHDGQLGVEPQPVVPDVVEELAEPVRAHGVQRLEQVLDARPRVPEHEAVALARRIRECARVSGRERAHATDGLEQLVLRDPLL